MRYVSLRMRGVSLPAKTGFFVPDLGLVGPTSGLRPTSPTGRLWCRLASSWGVRLRPQQWWCDNSAPSSAHVKKVISLITQHRARYAANSTCDRGCSCFFVKPRSDGERVITSITDVVHVLAYSRHGLLRCSLMGGFHLITTTRVLQIQPSFSMMRQSS